MLFQSLRRNFRAHIQFTVVFPRSFCNRKSHAPPAAATALVLSTRQTANLVRQSDKFIVGNLARPFRSEISASDRRRGDIYIYIFFFRSDQSESRAEYGRRVYGVTVDISSVTPADGTTKRCLRNRVFARARVSCDARDRPCDALPSVCLSIPRSLCAPLTQ